MEQEEELPAAEPEAVGGSVREAGSQDDASPVVGTPRAARQGGAVADKKSPWKRTRAWFHRLVSDAWLPDQSTANGDEADPPPRKGWFSQVRFAAPFGRYESADEQEPPAHEVMVGRDGQRAFFLDLLFNSGRRGAFLVTGRRGSGKSSFVRHCLSEYEDEVYQRFLRSNVGRTLFWDRILLALVGLAVVFVALLLTDLLEVIGIAAQASTDAARESALKPVPGKILLRLLGIPIIILCAYPWLYGRELFEVIFRARFESPGRRDRRAALLALGLSVLLAVAIFCFGPFGAPALGISRLMVVFAGAVLWVYLTNYREERSVAEEAGSEGADSQGPQPGQIPWQPGGLFGPRRPWFRRPACLVLPGLLYLWGGFGIVVSVASGSWPWAFLADPKLRIPRMEFTGDLGMTLSLFGAAAFIRGIYLGYNSALRRQQIPVRQGAKGYFLVGLALGAAGLLLLFHARWETPFLIAPLLAVLIFASRTRLRRRARSGKPLVFRPRPLVVLAVKATLCTAVAVQLLNPLLCDDNWVNREVRHLLGGQVEGFHALAYTLYPEPSSALNRTVRSPFPQAFVGTSDLMRSLPVGERTWHLEPGFPASSEPAPSEPASSGPASPTSVPATPGPSAGDEPTSGANSGGGTSDGVGSGDGEPLSAQNPRIVGTVPTPPIQDGLFGSTAEEVRWVFAVFLFGLLLYSCEYEWIVRPFHRHRVDRSFDPQDPAPYEDAPRAAGSSRSAYTYRMLARATLFWTVHHTWSPLLVCSVNLGFERLDHRRVVQAMLIDLRERYNRKFVAWNSVIGNVIRVVKVLVLILVVSMAGRHWFKLPEFDGLPVDRQEKICRSADNGYSNICLWLRGHQGTGGAAAALCNLDPGSELFHLAYMNLVVGLDGPEEPPYSTDNLLLGLLPYREKAYPWSQVGPSSEACAAPIEPLLRPGFEVRLYHLVLLALFYLFFRWVTTRLPLPPYRHTLARIDAVLDGLSSRRNLTSKQSRWGPVHWVRGFLSNERVEQLEQEPVDPRITEIAFLTMLRDINSSVLRLPGARDQVVSLPTPEVIFFFDELDKLGTRVDPSAAALPPTPQKSEEIDAERRRSLELHKLLADMKNMLSASDARFIFVGGRNLHDEWLADQTARQPLLTNIFNAEVYLPSLLTDYSRGEESFLHLRVERYLEAQKHRADALYEQTAKTLWRPELVINSLDRRSETFAQRNRFGEPQGAPGAALRPRGARGTISLRRDLNLVILETTAGRNVPVWGSSELLTDLIFFLSWRSLGNAKRLKELLATFVRPASRFVSDEAVLWQHFECRHVLAFRDIDRFRLQLIAGVYRHLTLHFEQSLVNRDDKLAASTFYLADFLFKFHDRAFSWGNLERVDELVHIHRAPDLRQLLESIVEKWSRWILHPIRNAMYGFRFRSDFAREISYLSRQSPDEMAAFNFTLDESQALKMLYGLRIRRLSSDAHGELAELYAALGELHEFDQEYEDARLFYRRALVSLDHQHEHIVGDGGLLSETTHHMDLLSRSKAGLEGARQYMMWGISRLRLMLQIAMTYERARDFERAGLKYRDARSLSNALLVAMLDDEGRCAFRGEAAYSPPFEPQSDRLHALKNLNIIFQPVFAEGWVAEKYEGGVDTGVALLETQLRLFRQVLPFVRSPQASVADDAYDVHESNFSLIISELHNKLGDTYFFRGKQPMTLEVLEQMIDDLGNKAGEPKKNRVGNEGYLMRAYYHYALGLHELRRYITYRRLSSSKKFNIMHAARKKKGSDYKLWETIGRMGWPDFVFRAVGESLNDLAEATLARVSLYGLLWTGSAGGPTIPEVVLPETKSPKAQGPAQTKLFGDLVDWFEGRDKTEPGEVGRRWVWIETATMSIRAGTIGGWLGRWNARSADDSQLLDFDELKGHHDPQRLLISLEMTCQSAQYLEKGGYRDEAAEELLEICAIVTRMIWWYVMVKTLVDPGLEVLDHPSFSHLAIQKYRPVVAGSAAERERPYWSHLFQVALAAFREADRLLRADRRASRFLRRKSERQEDTDHAYLVGSIIPPRALNLAASLGAACSLARDELLGPTWSKQREELCELIGEWTGQTDGDGLDYFLETLQRALVRHPYPMLSRLQGLKALIDATTLKSVTQAGDPLQRIQLDGDQLEEMLNYVAELQFLEAQYASPLHFTPLEMGVSLALVDLRFRASNAAGGDTLIAAELGRLAALGDDRTSKQEKRFFDLETRRRRLEEIRDEAKRYLQQSSETYTMRRAYYENIQRLYYLYDDFNDRQIHFNLAMQMVGSEICLILSELVNLDLERLEDAKGDLS